MNAQRYPLLFFRNALPNQPIDLVDGDQLADKLKELGLGVKTEIVEKVSIDAEWFQQI